MKKRKENGHKIHFVSLKSQMILQVNILGQRGLADKTSGNPCLKVHLWSCLQNCVGWKVVCPLSILAMQCSTAHKEVTFKPSCFLLVSLGNSLDQLEPDVKSVRGNLLQSREILNNMNSYWNDWISSVKICQKMVNVTFRFPHLKG